MAEVVRRTTVTSGTEWERAVGYSRAVRVGGDVRVSGTTATDENGEVVSEDPYEQAREAFDTVVSALEEAGASAEDVVRTRMFVTDIDDWEAIGRAHEETFGHVRPATSMVQVERLIDPAMVVEVEADAVVDDD